jgi:16S rRNA (cytosine1402-N4)-methyltransferase
MKNIIENKQHTPVMLTEALTGLNIKPDGIYIDGTFGRGGHSLAILNKLNNNGRLLVIDLDPDAIAVANKLQTIDQRVSVFHGSFSQIKEICQQANLINIDGILLDLGISSAQLADSTKGFSFSNDGPLDMRMDNTKGEPAYKWLDTATQEEIIKILREYGQERFAKKIAESIIKARTIKPITTTFALVEIIKKSCPQSYARFKHPATRTFQAIRIFVNKELLSLQQTLPQIMQLLAMHGRLVVISFHSLEDIIVKKFINQHSVDALSNNYAIRKFPAINVNTDHIKLKKIGRYKTSAGEIKNNNRSRSAIMRVAEKCA